MLSSLINIKSLAGPAVKNKMIENHTSWVAIVTPTSRPKSVRSSCVIEFFVGVFVLSLCILDFPVGVEAFVIGLSQISSFFSYEVAQVFYTQFLL